MDGAPAAVERVVLGAGGSVYPEPLFVKSARTGAVVARVLVRKRQSVVAFVPEKYNNIYAGHQFWLGPIFSFWLVVRSL
ncbi:MAG: hypothetical protein CMJ80_03255 [Planctomycetaceae bacterium]|nr:hypothetical protein [Planctomycetaceae bacterium]